jgi:hypothetical protein
MSGGERYFQPRHYMAVSGQLYPSSNLTSEEITLGAYFIGDWVDPRIGPDVMNKKQTSFPCRESNIRHPARSPVPTPTELHSALVGYLKYHGSLILFFFYTFSSICYK